MRLRLGFLGFVAAVGSAQACLWDTDTLQAETQHFPDVVQTIIGWFPRNPPVYYQLRIDRRLRDIDANPRDLNAYDDLAVAYARLGEEQEGLAYLKQQRSVLESLPQSSPDVIEHWYHYWANRGTLLAHDWIHKGHSAEEIKELREAEQCIQKALKLNPNAHFGRERVQLQVMKWLDEITIHPDADNNLGRYLAEETKLGDTYQNHREFDKTMNVVKGLDGLVVLGAAWESYDIYQAIAFLMSWAGKGRIATLAMSRCRELMEGGKHSLNPRGAGGTHLFLLWNTNRELQPGEEAEFAKARQSAEQENQRRLEYMMPLLKAGRHPDTDPTFWTGFTPGKPPVLEDHLPIFSMKDIEKFLPWAILGLLFLVAAGTAFVVRRSRSRIPTDNVVQ